MIFMKNIILFLLNFFTLALSFAQTKESQIQGIWANIMNSIEEEQRFKIIKGVYSLAISHEDDYSIDYYLNESLEGFVNTKSFDSISEVSFDKNGKYFITVWGKKENGWIKKPSYIIPDYFSCEDGQLSIGGGRLAEYTQIIRLPPQTIRLLYLRGKRDNRNYINEYLNINVKEIIAPKSIIYSEPGTPTKMYLIKGDVITVLEEQNGWIKVEYNGTKLVTGWIKKQAVGS
jgi:hypothetical protein